MAQNPRTSVPNQGGRFQNTLPTIEAYEALESRSAQTRWQNQKRIWNTNRTQAEHAKTSGQPNINSGRPIINPGRRIGNTGPSIINTARPTGNPGLPIINSAGPTSHKPIIRNSGRLPVINPGAYQSIGGSASDSNRHEWPLIQPAAASVNINENNRRGSSPFERSTAPSSGRLHYPSAVPTTNGPRTETRNSLPSKFQQFEVSPSVTFQGDEFANDAYQNDIPNTYGNPSKPVSEETRRDYSDEDISQNKTVAPGHTVPFLQQPIDQQPVFQQPIVPQPNDEVPNIRQPVVDEQSLYQQPIIVDPVNENPADEDPFSQQPLEGPSSISENRDAESENLYFDPPTTSSEEPLEFRTSAEPKTQPTRPDPVPDLIRPPADNNAPSIQPRQPIQPRRPIQPSRASDEPEKDPRKLQKVTDIFPYFDYLPDSASAGDDPCKYVCPRPDGAPCKTYARGERIPQCPADVPLTNDSYRGRLFSDTLYTWEASNVFHHPLYFEDVSLERYGHTYPALVQPFVSVSSVGRHLIGLPYQMVLNPPCKKEYPLGWYRPGECTPKLHYQIPLNGRATAAQAGGMLGLLLFP